MNATPTLSIGLPVYNGEDFLEESLVSLLAQTHSDLELIVTDNASTDRTGEIIQDHAAADARIRYRRLDRNLGAAANYNLAFRLARGEYFKWAAHDDVCAPEFAARCVALLESDPGCALAATRTRIIDKDGAVLKDLQDEPELLDDAPHRRLAAFLQYHNAPRECNAVFGLIPRRTLVRTGLIGPFPSSDMILLGQLVLHGRLRLDPEPLFLRRDHPKTSIRANRSWSERAAWFRPGSGGGMQFPHWRWLREYLINIRRAPLERGERIRCTRAVLRWAEKHRSLMMKELVRAPRAALVGP